MSPAGGRLAHALRLDALNRVWRVSLQGLLVTALVAAVEAAQQLLGAGPVDWRRLAYVAGSAAGMVVVTYAATAIRTGRLEPISVGLDALVRAGRTLLIGAGLTGAAAAVEVIRAALMSGSQFEPTRVAWTALFAAGTAIAAYLHRARLDPSPVPSAVPPVYVDQAGQPVPPPAADPVARADLRAQLDD